MAIGEVWRTSIEGTVGPNPVISTFHSKMLSSADPVPTLGAFWTSQLITLLQAHQSNQYEVTKLAIRRLSVPQIGGDYTTSYPLTGSDSNPISDIRSSLVASLRTATLGRSYRGRMFLGGFPADDLNFGTWSSTLVAAIATIFDDLVAAVGVGGSNADIQWGVWSRKLGDIPPPPGKPITGYNLTAGFQPITFTQVDSIGYTQRRRGVGVRIRD